MDEKERAAIKPCLGCGYCCKKARCAASFIAEEDNSGILLEIQGKIPRSEPECPFLYWNIDKYRCFLAKHDVYRQALAIEEGCCSPLNSERCKYGKSQEKTSKKQ